MQRELAVDAPCPACRQPALVLRTFPQDLPYFGSALHSVLLCEACGFREARTMFLEVRPAVRCTLRFRAPEDLGVRVARSHNATYRVPELGFVAEPHEGSEAFVTNVEGMLERVRDAVVRGAVLVPEAAGEAEALLARLQRILDGHEAATLVLEDPAGHSSILSPRAVVEDLSPEEAAALPTAELQVDLPPGAGGDPPDAGPDGVRGPVGR